jgi:hypothetical protein
MSTTPTFPDKEKQMETIKLQVKALRGRAAEVLRLAAELELQSVELMARFDELSGEAKRLVHLRPGFPPTSDRP